MIQPKQIARKVKKEPEETKMKYDTYETYEDDLFNDNAEMHIKEKIKRSRRMADSARISAKRFREIQKMNKTFRDKKPEGPGWLRKHKPGTVKKYGWLSICSFPGNDTVFTVPEAAPCNPRLKDEEAFASSAIREYLMGA